MALLTAVTVPVRFTVPVPLPNTVARPLVLGLTDNTSYEVLQGLSAGDTFISGTGGSGSGTNTNSPSGGGSSKGG